MPLSRYPECSYYRPEVIGDGRCDGYDANTEECGYDGGDCIEFNQKYPECTVDYPGLKIADGKCNGGKYNTEECGYDGGDCIDFNEKYPACKVDYPFLVGDGYCDEGKYNTDVCGYDGGDCVVSMLNGAIPLRGSRH